MEEETSFINTNTDENENINNSNKIIEDKIDYILVYKKKSKKSEKRKTYERNLENKSLQMEKFKDKDNNYVKIHAPNNILKQYCEVMKMKMPVKEEIAKTLPGRSTNNNGSCVKFKKLIGHILYLFFIETEWIKLGNYKITADYYRNRQCLFDDEAQNFFSTSDKSMIVNYILEHEYFDERKKHFGISKLLEDGVYEAAYPPHKGTIYDSNKERGILYKKWAQFSKKFSSQPIDKIKDYFGIKIALYFTWIGFYSYMLIPASFAGLGTLIYSFLTMQDDRLSNEICNIDENIIMCPLCDKYCDFWRINDACILYRIRYFVDNKGLFLFAFVMSIWSALYLKLWKRYSAEIAHRWGLTGFSIYVEQPRSDFRNCQSKQKKNDSDSNLSCCIKLPSLICSYFFILFWIALVLAIILSLVFYNMYFATSDYIHGTGSNKYKRTLFVPITAALINLIVIKILNIMYRKFALFLTNYECQRTQIEFDNSVQLKIFLFEFVNYYSPIFYIAFLKGKFIGYPGKYNRIFEYRQEECEPGGCLLEISLQIITFMVGEQIINKLGEYILPFLVQFKNSFSENSKCSRKPFRNLFKCIYCGNVKEKEPRWLEDIHLNTWKTELFDEYLEMVIQYGFVTLFVTAFPLAPFIALINNVFVEMRSDAKKVIKNYRRPIAQRVADIGIWYYIMKIMVQISILTNACIIAFSTNLIPMEIYKYNHGTYDGFLNYSLAYFNISQMENKSQPYYTTFNKSQINFCRYPEYRDKDYNRTIDYWIILAAKLVFVLIYQNIVNFVVTIIEWVISDTSQKLTKQIKNEEIKLTEILLDKKNN